MSHNRKSRKSGEARSLSSSEKNSDAEEIEEEKEGNRRDRRGLTNGTGHVMEVANKINYTSGKKAGRGGRTKTVQAGCSVMKRK